MLTVLKNPTYSKLFSAQIIALIGTGLLTVALGLFAFDIAGDQGGVVMGMAMTIKMVAYVVVTPLFQALAAKLPKKAVLIGSDVIRGGVALILPFATEAWHIYVLIFVLQSASAAFTPTFQALIPTILPEVREYTKALSLSRLAYDMESLASPALAGLLLGVMNYNQLFYGTVIGFAASALLVASAKLPHVATAPPTSSFKDRLTEGIRLFWSAKELRGLMGMNIVVAAASAMVIINSVVIVKGLLGRGQSEAALLLAVNGAGSMVVALTMVKLLDRFTDRGIMKLGGVLLPSLLLVAALVLQFAKGDTLWWLLIVSWFLLGAANSAILTPSARLLQRNSTEANRPAVFAAQFSLSHLAFLVTYPTAGTLGALIGMPATAIVLTIVGFAGTFMAFAAWKNLGEPGPAPAPHDCEDPGCRG